MRTSRSVVTIVAAALALAACKRKGGAGDADVEVARRIAGDSQLVIEQSLANAKDRIANRDPAMALRACREVIPVLPRLHASEHASLAVRLEQICRHELPLAELAAAVATVDEDPARCANVQATIAPVREAIAALSPDDAELAKLAARLATRCPP